MSGHWDDKKGATRMTKRGYSDDTLTTVIPLRVSGIYAKRYRE
ncbi:MAG: hypothetical protein ACEY3H_05320 [Wolbachia sp.]|nr:hypothetical protein [Wolbachia endosymbiont (group A) of Tiphia femorata]